MREVSLLFNCLLSESGLPVRQAGINRIKRLHGLKSYFEMKSVKSLNQGKSVVQTYDIVKAHGGELKVETPPAGRAGNEGVGSEFIIQLPI